MNFQVFSHLNADKAAQYRILLDIFSRAKASFILHLRPSEIASEAGMSEEDTLPLLKQLELWGNLAAVADTSDVSTVEEFYRARYFLQLTAQGEAAERALVFYREVLVEPAELQTTALADIRDQLRILANLTAKEEPGKVYLALSTLSDRFGQLTRRAQAFIEQPAAQRRPLWLDPGQPACL